MKKVLLTLLGIIVVVGVLVGAGFAGYRMGYMQGARANANGNRQVLPPNKGFDPRGMPMHNFGNDFERGFNPGFGPRGFGMMEHGMGGRGFGFFSPFFLLLRVGFWALIIWLVYKVIKGSGWTLTRQAAVTPQAEVAAAPEDRGNQTPE